MGVVFAFLFFWLSSAPAAAEEAAPPDAEWAAEWDGGDDADEGVAFAGIAEGFRKHCVRVFIHARTRDGDAPSTGTFREDILHERPALAGGYWWDERHVVIRDPVLPERFIRSIEIAPPGSEARFSATVAGYFTHMEALLLEVHPDGRGTLPPAHPLPFVEGDINEAITIAYGHDSGEWRLTLGSGAGLGDLSFSDAGEETAALSAQGVLLTAEGEVFGLSFGDELALSGDAAAYLGPETVEAGFFPRERADALRDRLTEQLSGAVLETVFRIRINVEEDDDGADRVLALAGELLPDGSAELRAAGLVAGARTLFVPVPLPPEGIARIEGIRVVLPGGGDVPARFAGAFRDYMALLVETEEDLPAGDRPEGFSLLDPNPPPGGEAAVSGYPLPKREFFLRRRVDYALGRRRDTAEYDRWLGRFRSFRGDPVVRTRTDEQDASLAFDTEGRLVALALTPRLLEGGRAGIAASPGFRPIDFLGRRLRAADALDPSLRPAAEEEGGRAIDFGVEFQPLDANTARLFHAAGETRAGAIGLLVTHVYPDSIAESLGVREHDVLLRFFLEGRSEPVDLRADAAFPPGEGLFDAAMGREEFQRLLHFLPPPWPSRETVISSILTGAGAGRRVDVEFLREGERVRKTFTTAFSPPEYGNAPRRKFPLLGLTVKPLTYEVRRFFGKPGGGGVIVSKVEEGGKGAVAGLHPYLLITHVDGRAVEGLDDFAARVERFESGAAPSVELTAESFGKTRLVRME